MKRVGVSAVRWGASALAVLLVAALTFSIAQDDDPGRAIQRDWTAFHRAGRLLLEGRSAEIYPGALDGPYWFLHPPFVLLPCAALAAVPAPWPAYLLCVVAAAACIAGALFCLREMLPAPGGVHAAIAAAVLSSAPWIGVVATGQASALVAWIACAGFLALRRNRLLGAGLLLSLLMLKPNLGLAFPIIAAVSRRWRLLGGILIGTGALVLASLPLGPGLWSGYFDASARMGEVLSGDRIPHWKQATLYASLRALLPQHDLAADIVWASIAIPAGLALLLAWRRRPLPEHLPRLLSATVLFLVACNPYLWFYDALLLAIPAAVWACDETSWASPRARGACGALIALLYAGQHASLLFLQDRSPPLLGPLAAAWLAIELFDLTRSPPSAGARTS